MNKDKWIKFDGKWIWGLLFSGMAIFSLPAKADDGVSEKSVRDLDRLIGIWRFSDTATEHAGHEYREEGIMRCSYVLDDRYIACMSEGNNGKSTRHYIHYWSYNDITDRYEMTGLFGNYGAKENFTVTISENGQEIELIREPSFNRNSITTKIWGIIKFESHDHFVWEVRLNRSDQSPDHWPLSYLSQYERARISEAEK